MSRTPRILLLSPRALSPPTRGDQLRAFHLTRALARRVDVSVLYFGAESAPPIAGVRQHAVRRSAGATVAANLAAVDPRLPLQTRLYLDRRMHGAVRAELARFRPDVLHVTLARLAPYARGLPGGVHVHVDFVDALSLNMATRARDSNLASAAFFRLEARLMARYEGQVAEAADTSSIVSERDRLASPGLASATVIPNGVAVDEFAFREPVDREPIVLFFGNLGYFHNVEPARMVALEVLPRLRRLAPAVSVRIAGARPVAAVNELADAPGVSVFANVPDMSAELHRAAVALLPASSGSGIKNKVLEAFAAGTPVVTNRAGIDGVVGAERGTHYLEADDPDGLAEACGHLLGSPEERVRLAAAARALVERDYSWDQRADALLELYRSGGERS
jgi:glycosyltransferase involved in cell wall biosynthesis